LIGCKELYQNLFKQLHPPPKFVFPCLLKISRNKIKNKFHQILTINLGYLCKLCDRFFCTQDEAHIRHCSSMEHYDHVCRRIAPPRPNPRHYRRPDTEPFELRGRREFVMAYEDNYKTLNYGELQDNLLRR